MPLPPRIISPREGRAGVGWRRGYEGRGSLSPRLSILARARVFTGASVPWRRKAPVPHFQKKGCKRLRAKVKTVASRCTRVQAANRNPPREALQWVRPHRDSADRLEPSRVRWCPWVLSTSTGATNMPEVPMQSPRARRRVGYGSIVVLSTARCGIQASLPPCKRATGGWLPSKAPPIY